MTPIVSCKSMSPPFHLKPWRTIIYLDAETWTKSMEFMIIIAIKSRMDRRDLFRDIETIEVTMLLFLQI